MKKNTHPLGDQKNVDLDLDAKLHQGHDASTEFKETSGVLSRVAVEDRKMGADEDHALKAPQHEGFFTRIVNAVTGLFSGNALSEEDQSNLAQAFGKQDFDNNHHQSSSATLSPPDRIEAGDAPQSNARAAEATDDFSRGGFSTQARAPFVNPPGDTGINGNNGGGNTGDGGDTGNGGDNDGDHGGGNTGGGDNGGGDNGGGNTLTPPVLAVTISSGVEDHPVGISITLTADPHATSTSIVISGLPAGATLSAGTNNGDGSWTLNPGQLTGLMLNPPPHSGGNFILSISATSSENGVNASTSLNAAVNISGEATTPALAVAAAIGAEDTPIHLNISASLVDNDGSETLSVTIANVPAGTTLSAGTHNPDGTWTLTPAELAGLTLTPPLHYSGSIDLVVTATSSENGTTASTSALLGINVTGVAQPPTISVQGSAGAEDTSIALHIGITLANPAEESLSITLAGVPAGAVLSAGTHNSDGTWTLSAGELNGLTLTPPPHYSGEIDLTVTATSSENGTTATSASTFPITIVGVATPPDLTVQAAAGAEDTTIALHISAALVDTDGSETLTIIIGNVPAGGTLSAGTHNADGTWTLTVAELANLTLTPPAHASGSYNLSVSAVSSENGTTATTSAVLNVDVAGVATAPVLTVQAAAGLEDTPIALNISAALQDTDGSETLSITIGNLNGGHLSAGTDNGDGTYTLTAAQLANLTYTPAPDFNGNLSLTVIATSSENGTSAAVAATLSISIAGTADAPQLAVQSTVGLEDTHIPLAITVSGTDSGETVSVTIGNIPPGAHLSAGTDNGDGSWTLSVADLAGLTFTPPLHASGSYNLSVTATTAENGTTASTTAQLGLTVEGTASAPTLSVVAAVGVEDTAIPLVISAALTDTDGSETLSITIGNLGGGHLSAGVNNGDGTYTLTLADLNGLTFTPPAHASGNFNLTVTATSAENGTTASVFAGIPVEVTGVATAPLLSAVPVTGAEDTAIALNIHAGLADTDGSETLSVTISNLPAGATLSAGVHNAGGSYTLTATDLAGLTLTPPLHYSGDINLSITATSSENGTTATTTINLPVDVEGVATTPLLNVQAAAGVEDAAIALNISAALQDTDGSETLSITVTNLPAGASLSAGTHNADGSWTLTSADLNGLMLTPPLHFSGNLNLSITATSSENGTTASTSLSLPVDVTGIALAPVLTAAPATGAEDTAIHLHIGATLLDNDGSETLQITIGNIPPGATLSAGIDNHDGSYTLTAAQLSGLTLTPPLHYSGEITLSVTATSAENGTTASTTLSLPVDVSGVATLPTLSLQAAVGLEDTPIALNIAAALQDTDGSETLSITISNLPAGATLSAGVHNADGSWTLTTADLANLTITPPLHESGSFNLTVTATSSENGTTAGVTSSLGLSVAGVATPPDLNVHAVAGLEDTPVLLGIAAALVDTDGDETLSIKISNLPPGATLSAGTLNADGSYTLTTAQLAGLTLTPPAHYSGEIDLTVTATSSENGTTANTSATLAVTVAGVATAPTLSVQAASGAEDTAIALHINAALVDTDGSETLSINITGVPANATLSAGTHNADGSWTLTAAQLSNLTLTPPANYSGTIALGISATSAENGTTATVATALPVVVTGVADTPALSVQAAVGAEGTHIALNINAALTDTDGSETLSITISNLPNGATLSAGTHNADGSWTLTPAQLTNLTLTPPAFFSGDISLNVTATSAEDGTSASAVASLPVTVTGVASLPTLTVHAAVGLEDTAIPLVITAGLTDTDGSETLAVKIDSLPVGATLSAGTHNADGSWTLSVTDLIGLTLTPPAHYSGDFNITVSAISSENGTTSLLDVTLSVTVAGVATIPLVAALPAVGVEDMGIPLVITAGLVDTDGSETLSVTISGLPAGATLSAGTHNADGSYTLTAADLAGLTLTPPQHWAGNFNLTVTATSAENGTTADAAVTLPVIVAGVANLPLLVVQGAAGSEDQPVALHIDAETVGFGGNQTLSIDIGNLPAGASLSAGTHNANGSWTLTAADLTNLTLTPPANWSGALNLSVTATATENLSTASTSVFLPLVIAGVADTPTLSVQAATGNEDTAIALHINAALTDTDGSETLSVIVTGVPTGATLSAGTHNPDGSWTLTSAQLSNLTLTPPANFSGSLSLGITAVSAENGTTATATATLPVTIAGVADAPALSVQAATGNEDTTIAIRINAALTDTDGSETLSVVIGNLPAGATLSAGIHNADGTYTLTAAQLTNLTLTPPANWSGSANLSVNAISSENGTTATTTTALPLTVSGIADAPTVSAQAAVGNEDTTIALHINAALTDTDGSETLAIIVGNLPAGATLSAGAHNADGTYTLTAAQLNNLSLTPPANWSGTTNLSITAVSSENGTTASTTTTLPLTVTGVADAPALVVNASAGFEDTLIPLHIAAAVTDIDGSETLSINISGLPTGASLSAGTHNSDGSWTLTPLQLVALALIPPANYSGSANLTVTATSSENGTTASTVATLPVTISGVADLPIITVQAAAGNEDTAIALHINAATADTDGSETLTVIIGGVPAGATLSAGTHNSNGTWTLTPAQLTNLTVTPPTHWSGVMSLSVTATAAEDGTTASSVAVLPVVVAGVATLPTLSVGLALGTEGVSIPLLINAALADTDGSETLSVTLSGLPLGATLNHGTHNSNGSWTLTTADLVGLTITPTLAWNGTTNLTVTATSSENGTTASTSTTLGLTVTAIADAPSLSVQAATGAEDSAIALHINAALAGFDPLEVLMVTVTGVPTGATLSAGVHNSDGSYTLTPAQLANLTLTPPANYSGSFTLGVTATSTELGTSAHSNASLPVTVTGVADTPTLSIQAATGTEDTSVPLRINAALVDMDGSETLTITVGNLPVGATLSAGTHNSDGTYTLTAAQLTNLTLTPPANWSGSANLSITATSSEAGTTASTTTTLPLTITGVADAPTLSIQAATSPEDTSISLHISSALTDTDGSEALSITIGNLPTGATLSAGIHNSDGTYTLTAAQLTNLTLTPPANWSGTANLSINATASEAGTMASTTASLPLTITGVADAPTLSIQAATGSEDTAIALHINAALVDTDGSETLTVTIGGLPAGATLSAGVHNSDGTYTLNAAQLTNLTLTPPANWSGTANLSVTATSSENGTTATVATTLPLTVSGVADAPTVSAQAATGNEDTTIALNINAALTDTDGSETLAIIVGNLPAGATLSAGVHNADGTYTLTTSQLGNLTLTPAANWSGTSNISVTAVSSENGTTASTTVTLPLTINGVADAPTLAVTAAAGFEDTPILLHITPALTDTDGSETLSVIISGLPAGASLSAGTHNSDGSWTLTPPQLVGLALIPPANYSGSANLTVTATSAENGTTASTTATLPVSVSGVADLPVVTVQAAAGNEDTAIALHITAATADTDGSETVSVTIGGIPTGATLSAGTHNANGTWTLTPAQLTNLTLTPPAHWSGVLALSVTATSSEDGTTASSGVSVLPVTIAGVATLPTLSVTAASSGEGIVIPLNITAALVDTDGSETLSVTVAGLPAGATLSAGTHNADGSYTLTAAQLVGLTLTPAALWNGTASLIVTATSAENGTTASATATLPLSVTASADAPTLSVQAAIGAEDTTIALHINAALAGIDPLEVLSVTVTGLPTGATLSAGTHNADGSYTLTAAQLTGLTLTPPANYSGSFNLGVTATSTELGTSAQTGASLAVTVTGVADTPTLSIQAAAGSEDTAIALHINAALTDTDGSETLSIIVGNLPAGATLSAGTHNADGTYTLTAAQLTNLMLTPPANWSGTANLSVTATSSEAGTNASTSTTLPLSIAGVADVPTLSIQAAAGNEDTTIAIRINAALTDTDGSETLSVTIGGLPAGATLSAGTHNADGTYTLTAAQLTGLTLTPPANWSGSASLSVTATSSENGTSASTSTTLPLTVSGVADTPTLSIQAASGNEDTAIAIRINAALTDTDGSETLSVTIGNLPAGATFSAGTHNADGTYTLTAAQLTGLTLTPGANWSGTAGLSITATSSENGTTASSTTTLPLTVSGIADVPTLSIQAASGNEDSAIAIRINAALTDTDGSETLSVTIGGLPTGATLSAGTHNADGTYTLTPAQLTGLTLTPVANWSGAASLTVTATASENGTTTSTTTTLPLTVSGVADTPTLSVLAAAGNEDTAIAIRINSALTDTDGSETLSLRISGLPAGATLSAGTHNADGSYTLTPAQLTGLTLTPAANWSGGANLTVTATSSENGTTASTTTTLPLTVAGIADTPTLSIQAAAGNEDTAIALHINAALTDTDGSEALSIAIGNVPVGATLSAGIHNADGTWTLTPSQLTGLTLTPPANWSGTFTLAVTAAAAENGTWATSTVALPVTVATVADAPNLTAIAASGLEDHAIGLTITSSLVDSSENLSILLSNVPTGATLSAGLYEGNGHWSLAASDLSGLTITPPANFSGTMAPTATAVSMASDGSTATTTLPVSVTVTPVADTPTLALAAVSGLEDNAISLNIKAALTDTDGSENLTVAISGVPTGATLSAGTNAGGGVWNLTSAQLTNLKITPAPNSDADFTLTVTATSHEGGNSSTASVTGTMAVNVTAVADVPTVSAANVANAATGGQVALTIAGAVTDTDGSETISYVIQGIPDGFALNKGTNNGDNSWSLTAAELSGLKLISPDTFNGQLNLYAQAISHDNDGSTAISATTGFYARVGSYSSGYLVDLGVNAHIGGIGVGVHVAALPDIDLFPASGGLLQTTGIYAKEDTPFLITDGAGLLGLPLLSAVVALLSKIQFQGIPTGVSFSAGVNKGGGIWEFTSAQLTNLTMTLPANSDVDFTIVTVAKLLGGLADITLLSTPVHVAGIADMPTLTASVAGTTEDHAVALNISGAVTDTDGSESISFLVSGMPAGFTLNHGTDNGNGTWSLRSSDLTGLTVTPANDYSGTASITVSAIATEREGDQTVKQTTLSLPVTAIADAPTVVPVAASAKEDNIIALNLGISLKDTDGSERISAVTISGLPAGATLTGATDNHNGTWSADVTHLDQVKLVTAPNWHGDASLSITATSQETSNSTTASTTTSLAVHVEAAADAPAVTATDSTGNMGTAIGLHVGAALTDSGEHLSAVISGVPQGAVLSAGLDNGDGTWSLRGDQLSTLQITPADHFTGDLNLSLTAYSREDNGSTASATSNFTIHVLAVTGGTGDTTTPGSWLDATSHDAGGTAAAAAQTAAENSQAAIDAAVAGAHTAGTDYEHTFQTHQTG